MEEEVEQLNVQGQKVNRNSNTKPKFDTSSFWNGNRYAVLYGITGCLLSTASAYFNGIITTLEKRFNIASRNTGIISMGNNISQIFVVLFLTYHAGRGHRPKWLSFGVLTLVIYCLLSIVPHFIWGSGTIALTLTSEFGNETYWNTTLEAATAQSSRYLCGNKKECDQFDNTNLSPQIILFIGHVISGIGIALFYTLGIAYMDDNTERSKTPAMLSFTFFLNLLGPSLGYSLVSICLSYYISPLLTPVIDNQDPRWLGAWWMGWLLLASLLLICSLCFRTLPQKLKKQNREEVLEVLDVFTDSNPQELISKRGSHKEMMESFSRLCRNKTYMINNISSIFYFFGYTPYWIFTPKYLEIQFRQTAATSSLATGSVAFLFTAVGILSSGFIISKFKPSARYLAGWNVIVGFLSVTGIIAYAFIGCLTDGDAIIGSYSDESCSSGCDCDYVPYSPVCGENGVSYVSACHAGCHSKILDESTGRESFFNCTCIPTNSSTPLSSNGFAKAGSCAVDCLTQFYIFLTIMCIIKFLGAAGRTSNLIVSIRCVEEKDKTVSMGLGMALISLFTFIPSPIFFGYVFDSFCTYWGSTCTNQGNCWSYNTELLRYALNLTAAFFVFIGSLLDCGVWYYVKDLKVFSSYDDNALEMTTLNE